MYAPEVSLAIGRSPRLDEAVVEREIVSDAITPARSSRSEVGIVL